jgi:hypothetical protein
MGLGNDRSVPKWTDGEAAGKNADKAAAGKAAAGKGAAGKAAAGKATAAAAKK